MLPKDAYYNVLEYQAKLSDGKEIKLFFTVCKSLMIDKMRVNLNFYVTGSPILLQAGELVDNIKDFEVTYLDEKIKKNKIHVQITGNDDILTFVEFQYDNKTYTNVKFEPIEENENLQLKAVSFYKEFKFDTTECIIKDFKPYQFDNYIVFEGKKWRTSQ